jgi:hypothetical protein
MLAPVGKKTEKTPLKPDMDFDEAMRRVSKIKPVRKSERSAVEIQRVSPKSHETVMYCSPHPAALHIAPAARLRDFAFMILRPEAFSLLNC